jgi:hypothetical protein
MRCRSIRCASGPADPMTIHVVIELKYGCAAHEQNKPAGLLSSGGPDRGSSLDRDAH